MHRRRYKKNNIKKQTELKRSRIVVVVYKQSIYREEAIDRSPDTVTRLR